MSSPESSHPPGEPPPATLARLPVLRPAVSVDVKP